MTMILLEAVTWEIRLDIVTDDAQISSIMTDRPKTVPDWDFESLVVIHPSSEYVIVVRFGAGRAAAGGETVVVGERPGDVFDGEEEYGVEAEKEHGAGEDEEEDVDGETGLVCDLKSRTWTCGLENKFAQWPMSFSELVKQT